MIQTKERKRFKDLNLLDRFLFAEAMEDNQNMELLLDIILNQTTHLKQPTQTEKECRRTNEDRQVRLDVYAMDEEDVVYDAEPQKTNTKNFPKRSRLYQGLIDSNLLPPGSIDFNALNTVVVILITPFDIFGRGLYKYTFHMKCEEVPELQLDDGATRIFLNTHGKHPELVSEELIELLKYMEKSTEETAEHCKSEKVQELHQKISRLKKNKQVEAKFMQAWEEKVLDRQEAYAEGRQAGEQIGEARGRLEGEKAGEERERQEIADLCGKLAELNRMEDIQRAITDMVYRRKLLEEFKAQ